jgi:hypothetical protein
LAEPLAGGAVAHRVAGCSAPETATRGQSRQYRRLGRAGRRARSRAGRWRGRRQLLAEGGQRLAGRRGSGHFRGVHRRINWLQGGHSGSFPADGHPTLRHSAHPPEAEIRRQERPSAVRQRFESQLPSTDAGSWRKGAAGLRRTLAPAGCGGGALLGDSPAEIRRLISTPRRSRGTTDHGGKA